MNERVYYIAEVSGIYNNTRDFKIEPFVGYIVDSEGYNTISTYNNGKDRCKLARKFESPCRLSLTDISNPWYYKAKEVKWVKVTETFDRQEEYVNEV